ncbi:hypothetical protein NM688_g4847 [Phlebia brevispora]|uniref:Uncharacterized protein n=1 Tax=Phlebia brevispora TaxID=194682 RepID=A0ACC1T1I0_9APHY|nr:hypothetical protein NM688_g4847 [Phlebia brevispora]
MPEYRELIASHYTVRRWLDDEHYSHYNLSLQALWADVTRAEKAAAVHPRAKQGHVFKLSPTDSYFRGSGNDKRPLFPPAPWSGEGEIAEVRLDPGGQEIMDCSDVSRAPVQQFRPLCALTLQDVQATPRTILLNMGELYFQAHLQTHVTCQVYTRTQWDEEVCRVVAEQRGFKIAMAFDFGPHGVLAFVSMDLLFTPNWASKLNELPPCLPDVYTDYKSFVDGVAHWIIERRTGVSNRGGLAVIVIRDANKVFAGIGVYTVIEVFFLAGLSVFLTEYEVFSSPSRVARLCEASLLSRAKKFDRSFLKPCYRGYALAATKKQRLRFSPWLHVFGKSETLVSERMYQLSVQYATVLNSSAASAVAQPTSRDGLRDLYDVFEPTLIQPALEKQDSFHLGHWIFGQKEWLAIGGTISKIDPLALAFGIRGIHPRYKGFSTELTHLKYDMYCNNLFLESPQLRKRKLHPQMWTGATSGYKPVWSITPNFPENLVSVVDGKSSGTSRLYANPSVNMRPMRKQWRHTFQHVVTQTREVMSLGTAQLHPALLIKASCDALRPLQSHEFSDGSAEIMLNHDPSAPPDSEGHSASRGAQSFVYIATMSTGTMSRQSFFQSPDILLRLHKERNSTRFLVILYRAGIITGLSEVGDYVRSLDAMGGQAPEFLDDVDSLCQKHEEHCDGFQLDVLSRLDYSRCLARLVTVYVRMYIEWHTSPPPLSGSVVSMIFYLWYNYGEDQGVSGLTIILSACVQSAGRDAVD